MIPIAALDLGSGTIKLSVFQIHADGWQPLSLEEANTELRRGLGTELTLKPGPIKETLAAASAFLTRSRVLGAKSLPAYATSAVRRSRNPEALIQPLRDLGIETKILNEEEEGRWNLLGALAHGRDGGTLVLDPGGDSTECCAGDDWKTAPVASLALGSVSLQERFGGSQDNDPIAWASLEHAREHARQTALAHPVFQGFLGQDFEPAIRMNAPIQRALELVNGRPIHPHGQGGPYRVAELERLCRHLAGLKHSARATLLDGEPIGKVDRTCYGFASWLGILDALQAPRFHAEPWGIKLGAVLALNATLGELHP